MIEPEEIVFLEVGDVFPVCDSLARAHLPFWEYWYRRVLGMESMIKITGESDNSGIVFFRIV